jgi:lipopolysaccharide export system protein LptC
MLRHLPFSVVFPLLLLSVLAGLTVWLNQTVRAIVPPPPVPIVHQPDYIIEGFTIKRYTSDGDLRYIMQGDKMVHFPDNDLLQLTRPHITRYRPETLTTDTPKPPTRMRADRGAMTLGGDQGYFYDNVVFHRPAFKDDDPLTIYTSYAHIVSDFDLFRTTEDATIVKGKNTIQGRGMEYDHSARTLTVLTRVQASFEKKEKDRPKVEALPAEFAKGLNPDFAAIGPARPAPLPPVIPQAPPGVPGQRR